MTSIPLSAIISGERVIGPDLPDEEWNELKAQHRLGLAITMPCCGMSGHPRTSKCGLKHFYHARKSKECRGKPESLEHLRLKNQIYQICKSEGWKAQPEYQSPTGDWRADVYATRGNRCVVFEVQLSQIRQEELQERESKYARDGIESYWLLRNYLDLCPHYKVWIGCEEPLHNLSIDENDFSLSCERLYYVQKGIRTIGINSDNRTLCTTKNPSTELKEWVKYTLNGDYSQDLIEFKAQHQRHISLRASAMPVLKELEEFEQKYYEYRRRPDRLYAVFKKHTWADYASLKEEIKLMYTLFQRFKDTLWKIYSPRNGFIWRDCPYSEGKYRQLKLISEYQISSIREQVRALKGVEAEFSSIFTDLEKRLEKDLRKNQTAARTVAKELLHTPNGGNQEQQDKVDFKFSNVLPTLTLISQRGTKYQNPWGCTWSIGKDDAIEFEQKGYGKIVK